MLYIGVPALALGLTFAAVALLTRNELEFAFLKGRTPIRFPMGFTGGRQVNVTCYSFKADFAAIRRNALAELESKGYWPTTVVIGARSSYRVEMDIEDTVLYETRSASAGRIIAIHRDVRLDTKSIGSHRPVPVSASGWVFVTILGEPQPGVFSRFSDWIGL
jgi:hypothetical protein